MLRHLGGAGPREGCDDVKYALANEQEPWGCPEVVWPIALEVQNSQRETQLSAPKVLCKSETNFKMQCTKSQIVICQLLLQGNKSCTENYL